MKTVLFIIVWIILAFIGCCIIMLSSCGNNNQDASNKTPSVQTDESTKQKDEGLSTEFLGNYHGIQSSYFMKNQYGDEMVINGNKISVPFLCSTTKVVRSFSVLLFGCQATKNKPG